MGLQYFEFVRQGGMPPCKNTVLQTDSCRLLSNLEYCSYYYTKNNQHNIVINFGETTDNLLKQQQERKRN